MTISHLGGRLMQIKETALVTGASSGLGAALAEELASRGYDLILTARSKVPMDELAARLRSRPGVNVTVVEADLSQHDGVTDLTDRLDAQGLKPTVVVNNAGFGLNERFVNHDGDRLAAMLRLNVLSLSELSRFYGQRMAAAGRGYILLVASVAAYQPDPLMAAYGASKAYVLSLGEALHVELSPRVGVTVLSPGFMETGFSAVSGFEPTQMTVRTALSPAKVARIGLEAMFRGQPTVVAGGMNRAMVFITRLLPRMFVARQVAKAAGASLHAK
jgi:short-subunit dehydrogenase